MLVRPPQRGGGRLLARVGFFQPLRLAGVADPQPVDERLEREALDEERHQNHNVREENDQIAPRERRSEEHTSELQSQSNLVCRLLLEKKKLRYILESYSAH